MTEQHFQAISRLIYTVYLILALLALAPIDWLPTIAAQQPDREDSRVDKNHWEAIFFREINERARLAKLTDLRGTLLKNNDLELRVWIGFGPVALKGFVLKRRNSIWSGTYLRSINRFVARNDYQKILAAPKSGWEVLWKRLENDGVLTLPGATESGVQDGESYVVEIKTASSYRTYMYANPMATESRDGRNIIEIVQTIRDEFDVPR
jgi:hypothetical protein